MRAMITVIISSERYSVCGQERVREREREERREGERARCTSLGDNEFARAATGLATSDSPLPRRKLPTASINRSSRSFDRVNADN